MEEMLYTVAEVADILKVSTDYVYDLKKSGLLKFLKIGRWKVRRCTLEDFLARYENYDISDPYNIRDLSEVKQSDYG